MPEKIGLLTSVGQTLDAFFPEIVKRWEDRGTETFAAAGDRSVSFARQTVIAGLTRKPSLRNGRSLCALRSWANELQLDVVITNTSTASTLVRAAGLRIPVIYFCHGLHWNGTSVRAAPYKLLERILLPRTDGVVCLNSADESWFAKHGPSIPRLRLINGVGLDVQRYSRVPFAPWDRREGLRIVWCGELTARKNPIAVIKLARVLSEQGIDFTLEILGRGPVLSLADIDDSLKKRVSLVGHVDPVPSMKRAHVLVQTSRWEALPRVALEAVALGRPTVGFDVKGVQDIPGAFLAPEGDIDALARAVLEAATLGPRNLPPLEDLSVRHAADALINFARGVKAEELSAEETILG